MLRRLSPAALIVALTLSSAQVSGQERSNLSRGLEFFLRVIGTTFAPATVPEPDSTNTMAPEPAPPDAAPAEMMPAETTTHKTTRLRSTTIDPQQDLWSFLQQNCAACHGGKKRVVERFDVLQPVKLEETGLVNYGQPEASVLWKRVSRGEMPPPQSSRLSRDQRTELQRLIARASANDIVNVCRRDPRLQLFVDWAERTRVDRELRPDGAYTIFAPTNEAIESLGKQNLNHLLEHPVDLLSVVQNNGTIGAFTTQKLLAKGRIWTLVSNLDVRQDQYGIWIKDAKIIQPDIQCSNGVVHVTDRVLISSSVVPKLPEPIRHPDWEIYNVAMISVPGGEFLMGAPPDEKGRSPNDGPQHRVELSPFQISRCEITRIQFDAAMKQDPSDTNMPGPREQPNDDPVQMVTWYQAVLFCNELSRSSGLPPYYRLTNERPAQGSDKNMYDVAIPNPYSYSFRLPTETEWEYACRAGPEGTGMFCFGDSLKLLDEYAWHYENAGDQLIHPVGEKKANKFGLCDMHGNVAEWCHDWYQESYDDSQLVKDPRGPLTGEKKVVRGGSYFYDWSACRCAARFEGRMRPPFYHHRSIGFRVARYQPPESAVGNRRFAPASEE